MKRLRLERALTFFVEVYRLWLSSMLPSSCRFLPTCSDYTREAIIRYGPGRGVLLGIQRLLKCHPFHKGGLDPLPPKV